MEKIAVLQTEYDQLVEERLAFKEAGMDAKVVEWEHKIKLCEASMHYPRVTFDEIARDLGISGLDKAAQERNLKMDVEIARAREYAKVVLGRDFESRRLSESKMWDIINKSDYRFVGNPLAKIEAMRMMIPKLSGTARNLLMYTLSEAEKKMAESMVSHVQAYVKVVGIESYKENDNPPMEVLGHIADAIRSGLFTALFVAFPMIGPVKQVDPIVFGIVSDREKKLWNMDDEELLRFNRDLSVEDLKILDFGNLFRITEWV